MADQCIHILYSKSLIKYFAASRSMQKSCISTLRHFTKRNYAKSLLIHFAASRLFLYYRIAVLRHLIKKTAPEAIVSNRKPFYEGKLLKIKLKHFAASRSL